VARSRFFSSWLRSCSSTRRTTIPDRPARQPSACRPDIKLWEGDSRGRWEGNTPGRRRDEQQRSTRFAVVGDFHSDTMRVTERWTFVRPQHRRYKATIDDPKASRVHGPLAMQFQHRSTARPELIEIRRRRGETSIAKPSRRLFSCAPKSAEWPVSRSGELHDAPAPARAGFSRPVGISGQDAGRVLDTELRGERSLAASGDPEACALDVHVSYTGVM